MQVSGSPRILLARFIRHIPEHQREQGLLGVLEGLQSSANLGFGRWQWRAAAGHFEELAK